MLLRFDVAAALVHVQLAAHVLLVLQREQQVVGVDDRHRAVGFDVARVHGAGRVALDVQHRFVHVRGEHERQLLEALDDLVDVLHHAGNGLMLVDHAVQAERPHGGAAQRREQHAPQRVAEGVAVAALEGLEAEFGGVGVVLALRHFDDVRTDQPGQIESSDHLL